jgi:hypothetical protein
MTPEQIPSQDIIRTEKILEHDIKLLNARRNQIINRQSESLISDERTGRMQDALTNGIEKMQAKIGTIQAIAGYRDAIELMETEHDYPDDSHNEFIAMRKGQLARFEAYLDADTVLQKRLRRPVTTPNELKTTSESASLKGKDIFSAERPVTAPSITIARNHFLIPNGSPLEAAGASHNANDAEHEKKAVCFERLESALFDTRHKYSLILGNDKKQVKKRVANICRSLAEIDRLFPELKLTASRTAGETATIPAGKAAGRMYPGVNFDRFRGALIKLRETNILQTSEASLSLPIRDVPLSATHLAAIRVMEEMNTIIDPFNAVFVRNLLHDALYKLGELGDSYTATALPIGPMR